MSIRPLLQSEYQDPSFGANCIGCSPRNIKGLGLKFAPVADEVHAEVNLSSDYESYPGMIHGGVVALILDEVMGRAALWRARALVLTVGIRIRYAALMKPDTRYLCRGEAVFTASGQLKGSGFIEDAAGGLIAAGNATFARVDHDELAAQNLPESLLAHLAQFEWSREDDA